MQAGWSALHIAAQAGNVDVVRALIEVGTDPEVKNRASLALGLRF